MDSMEGMKGGIKVGGKLIQDVRFAVDQGTIASTEKGLQKIVDKLSAIAENFGMKINIKKER